MAPSASRLVIGYTGAFLSGAVGAFMALRLLAAVLPAADGPGLSSVLALAAPVVGAAVFQAIFGTLTGLGRGRAFWPVALAIVYLLLALALGAVFLGVVAPSEAAAVYLVSVYGVGLWAAFKARPPE